MERTNKITTTDVKKYNKNRVFKLIYFAGKISRQAIANILQLSLPTVNQNLKLLYEDDLIYYEGSFDSTGGRKAQVIAVNPHAAYTVCVNLNDKGIKVWLIDLKGDVVDSDHSDIMFSPDDEYGIAIAEKIIGILKKNGISESSVLGVGITVPGVFDRNNRIILAAPTMGLKDYHISHITKNIPFECVAMNDARAGAYAEYWCERKCLKEQITAEDIEKSDLADYMRDRVYVMLDNGVGGAYIGSDRIITGVHNRCGEVGHMTIHPDGRQCFCGRKGCFESYVSARCLSSELGMTLDEFFEGLEAGDAVIESHFERYIDDLTTGINNMYMMTDTDIIVGGPVSVYLEQYVELIRSRLVEKYSFDTDGSYFRIGMCDYSLAQTGGALPFIDRFVKEV